jgi:TetR/AcrR family transcriptional regulator, lmrAB and yxaGH operons repressor
MAEGSARDKMVDSTLKLLAAQGFQGASFSAILEDSQAPRGSIYHHFPGGKDQLVLAALDRAGAMAQRLLEGTVDTRPEDVVRTFVGFWRTILTRSDFRVGCSLAGVTVSANDDAIVEHAAGIFRAWQTQVADVLVAAGVPAERGPALATMLLASCEGAVVLCRAERSLRALDSVEQTLLELVGSAA